MADQTASQQLRGLLDQVAAGTVSPELATATISRWLVIVIGATKNVDVERIIGEHDKWLKDRASQPEGQAERG